MAEPARFERRFTVTEADIDRLGHVNNVVYLQWVQDVAGSHWEHAASSEQRDAIVWVAVRHEIDYKAPAFEGDEILARTWVERWSGVKSERHTEIRRASDAALLAKAITVWAAVDPQTQRPRRLDRSIEARFVEAHEPPGPAGPGDR